MKDVKSESIKKKAVADLEHMLHEATTKELLYFMAKILEELTSRNGKQ